MGKNCELCGEKATLFCSADDANLCWSCDATVHSANFLVSRHMRSLLCLNCSAETECQTSGPHPFPLARSCAACDPAHVEEEETEVKESKVDECNDDSEDLRAAAAALPGPATSAGLDSWASQDSLADAHSSVEDEMMAKDTSQEELKAKTKRMRVDAVCRTVELKRTLAPGHSRRLPSVKKSKKKRSASPVSVMSMEMLLSNGTWDDDDVAEGYGAKAQVVELSLLPPRA